MDKKNEELNELIKVAYNTGMTVKQLVEIIGVHQMKLEVVTLW